MSRQRVFFDVDTQRDFMDPGGALYVAGAEKLLPALQALTRAGCGAGRIPVLASADSHNLGSWELSERGGPFPPHCIKGTAGWLKCPETLPEEPWRAVFIPNAACEVRYGGSADAAAQANREAAEGGATGPLRVPEGTQMVVFEKEVFSAFANPNAAGLIAELLAAFGVEPSVVTMTVYGVATDYCIKGAALGLRERGYDVEVIEDAIAAVDVQSGDGARAIEAMREAGVRFVTAADVLGAPVSG